jgi:hypothetical protein
LNNKKELPSLLGPKKDGRGRSQVLLASWAIFAFPVRT